MYSNHILFNFVRVLQDINAAMLLPNGLAILGATYPPGKQKAMIFALFGAVAPNNAVLGAVLSDIFSQLAWWPWTFWTQAIVAAVCAGLGLVVIPSIHHDTLRDTSTLGNLLKTLDVPGAFCGIGGLVLVNIA